MQHRRQCVVATLLAATLVIGLSVANGAVAQSPPPPQAGPYLHRVLSAVSPDGLTWTADNHVLLEHASVPCAIMTPEGNIRLYYVDASQMPETANCAESTDGGSTFTVLGLTIANLTALKALDPSIVRLVDGRYRLYYYGPATQDPSAAGAHSIYSAISDDGVAFTEEQQVFSYDGLVDPDVFQVRRGLWYMFVFSLADGRTIIAKSRNGTTFKYLKPLALENWGTTAPVKIDKRRYRLYAFNQNGQQMIGSFVSRNALKWTQESGDRLTAAPDEQITDPQVIQLPDGSWKMFYKSELAP
jgi:hypothetical protein